MSIFPLPMFERDADPKFRDGLSDEEIYARLKAPTSIVCKFGRMKLIGEYPYRGDAKPGCGSKLVVRTFRAVEIAEMLTTTCSNSGCGKSVSRSEMMKYIENSGGRDYPFQTNGEILRVATVEDLNRATACSDKARAALGRVREMAATAKFPAKIVDLELTLDESLLLVFYLCDERIDFRELAQELASEFACRIEMRQVGARDEARLVADYERCGQHCCCKNFLKVLKPISMRSAKIQKATLDPLKISGRCGRLMCCLRYEDSTYEDLRKRLPKNKTRVGTAEGPGIVVDSKILVQLVLVKLDALEGEFGREIAVPVEELMDPNDCPAVGSAQARAAGGGDAMRGMSQRAVREKLAGERNAKLAKQDQYHEKSMDASALSTPSAPSAPNAPSDKAANGSEVTAPDGSAPAKKKRRKRKRRKSGLETGGENAGGSQSGSQAGSQSGPQARASDNSANDNDDGDEGDEGDDGEGDDSTASNDGTNAQSDAGVSTDGANGAAGDAPRRRKRRGRGRRRGGGPGGNSGPDAGGSTSGPTSGPPSAPPSGH